MDHIGFDLGKVNSQLCIITGEGELIERRISTSHDSLTKLLGSRPPAHILIEAATESEWVARHLESLGHKVVVADPTSLPCTLLAAVASRPTSAMPALWPKPLGWELSVPPHRTSDQQRHVRAQPAPGFYPVSGYRSSASLFHKQSAGLLTPRPPRLRT